MLNRSASRNRALQLIPCLTLIATVGCSGISNRTLLTNSGGSAALFNQFQAFDGHTGRSIEFAEVAGRCRSADVVFFGEEHSNSVCNQLEAQLLAALAQDPRPLVVAMEFFEKDTQPALDDYLAGRLDETAFREKTRQKGGYTLSHRPLIELCRAANIPVLAANVPRRFLREYGQSGKDYDAFRADLSAADIRWVPRTFDYVAGPYRERFFEVTKSHPPAAAPTTQSTTATAAQSTAVQPITSQPAELASQAADPASPSAVASETPATPPLAEPAAHAAPHISPEEARERGYLSQLLWDNSMAESLADCRRDDPKARVMLVVGSFHVAHEGGTLTEFRRRSLNDRICTIVFQSAESPPFSFEPADRHAADIVIYGLTPPEK